MKLEINITKEGVKLPVIDAKLARKILEEGIIIMLRALIGKMVSSGFALTHHIPDENALRRIVMEDEGYSPMDINNIPNGRNLIGDVASYEYIDRVMSAYDKVGYDPLFGVVVLVETTVGTCKERERSQSWQTLASLVGECECGATTLDHSINKAACDCWSRYSVCCDCNRSDFS